MNAAMDSFKECAYCYVLSFIPDSISDDKIFKIDWFQIKFMEICK